MSGSELSLRLVDRDTGRGLVWFRGDQALIDCSEPAAIEITPANAVTVAGQRRAAGYSAATHEGYRIVGRCDMHTSLATLLIADSWSRIAEDTWRVDRSLQIVNVAEACGVRLLLDLRPGLPDHAYGDFRYFAPPALYDLNDLNEDGVEDYLETRSLHFREDRLNLRSLLAWSDRDAIGFVLSRADRPEFDSVPERNRGVDAFLQRTDIGSLGIEPADQSVALLAAYPFAERTRSHALLVKQRSPFAAFWPGVAGETCTVSYLVRLVEAEDVHEAIWHVWRRRFDELAPRPVELAADLSEIMDFRLGALLAYHIEETEPPRAAGFVTNCHPQDGRQLSNVIQFGFTGQNNLNAFGLLRAADDAADSERRRKALRAFDFFVEIAGRSDFAFVPGYYNADTHEFGSWWTGLILPLAYARPDGDLESLMGPLYGHLQSVIEALADREGVYLRCVVEEHDALLAAYAYEHARGRERTSWLAVARAFGDFLVGAQQADGSWYRAYTPKGEAITEPESWFGQTEVQRKSSTASAVPLLVTLHILTGEPRFLEAARRGGAFAERNFVDRIKFNGGIHDSIYAKPQLVDGESIMFAMRALLALHKATGEQHYLDGARRAAQLVVTWVCLWDVPLPPDSTLARFGFRSTGWMACDAPGAGYIHPMGILAVPDLVGVGLLTGDKEFLKAADLLQAGCNETVSVPGKAWGYAMPGLQEEGLLISWWFADDPMFGSTGFGGRGKGEGNKTCLPWISAVSICAYQEMMARYGTTDIATLMSGPQDSSDR